MIAVIEKVIQKYIQEGHDSPEAKLNFLFKYVWRI